MSPRISGRLRNGQERANIPESEKTLPLNFAHFPPGNLCHTHVRINRKKVLISHKPPRPPKQQLYHTLVRRPLMMFEFGYSDLSL